jgi:hypothetical protein
MTLGRTNKKSTQIPNSGFIKNTETMLGIIFPYSADMWLGNNDVDAH